MRLNVNIEQSVSLFQTPNEIFDISNAAHFFLEM